MAASERRTEPGTSQIRSISANPAFSEVRVQRNSVSRELLYFAARFTYAVRLVVILLNFLPPLCTNIVRIFYLKCFVCSNDLTNIFFSLKIFLGSDPRSSASAPPPHIHPVYLQFQNYNRLCRRYKTAGKRC
jgi:hypothetical protein